VNTRWQRSLILTFGVHFARQNDQTWTPNLQPDCHFFNPVIVSEEIDPSLGVATFCAN